MTTHGMSKTKEYQAWANMKSRCLNENWPEWKYYGGRGITICDEWRNDFSAFYRRVGKAPGPEYSLDRIENNGNYEPGNVKWSTDLEQNNNQRSNWFPSYQLSNQQIKALAELTRLARNAA